MARGPELARLRNFENKPNQMSLTPGIRGHQLHLLEVQNFGGLDIKKVVGITDSY